MMKALKFQSYLFFIAVLIMFFQNNVVFAEPNKVFSCGGSVESEAWSLWDTNVRNYLGKQLLQGRLKKQGDVYALYNFQLYSHNAVSMAQRCNRIKRLQEIARLIQTAYDVLEQGSPPASDRQWICRGGNVCNDKNNLLNNEVMLCSVQFLGLASSVANALATSKASLSKEDKIFIKNTHDIAIEHLLRWGDKSSIDDFKKLSKTKPGDVKGGSSIFFFTDKPLWQIAIYAELAGIIQNNERQKINLSKLSPDKKEHIQQHLNALIQFFVARVSIYRDPKSRLGNVNLADIDRGYWRLYADSRYAGYEKSEKPVECVPPTDGKSKFKMEVRVSPSAVPKRDDTGWDISHGSRIVHALDALERNHNDIKNVFKLTDQQLPNVGLAADFTNTVVAVMWNGDENKPLFSNWWSGANGWYRVAYDNKTGQCREGTPPFGLTISFPTGGYITWAQYNPTIGLLGQKLYELTSSNDGKAKPFIIRYYPGLRKSVPAQKINLARFMFLPSLVGIPNEK